MRIDTFIKKGKERQVRILSDFKNKLQDTICKCSNIDNPSMDIYLQIKGMNSHEIFRYFYKKIKTLNKKTKGIKTDVENIYEYWLCVFIETSLCVYPFDKNYDAKGISGWIIKQIYSHCDKYQTIAYLISLKKIWMNGRLGKEFKGYVKAALQDYGEDINNYGIFNSNKVK